MRLFKLLIIGLVVGGLYLYAKQNTHDKNSWTTITTTAGIAIQFPTQPVSKSFNKNIDSLGKVKLTTYQSKSDNHMFILLQVTPMSESILQKKMTELESIIHTINDTRHMTINHRQAFVLQNHYGLEYQASDTNDSLLWCRTVKKGNQLYSLITASNQQHFDKALRDRFFRSIHL